MPFYVRTLLVTASPDQAVRALGGHREQLRELHARGRLRLAGELADGEGFVDVFEARDRLAAEEIARASPLAEEGLATWLLREWVEIEF